jgi:hypothetical protein
MDAMADRLGEEVLNLVERLVPSAAQFQEHSLLIGRCLIVALALIVIWSVSGLVRR